MESFSFSAASSDDDGDAGADKGAGAPKGTTAEEVFPILPKTRSTMEPTTRMSVSRKTTGGVLERPAAAQRDERLCLSLVVVLIAVSFQKSREE